VRLMGVFKSFAFVAREEEIKERGILVGVNQKISDNRECHLCLQGSDPEGRGWRTIMKSDVVEAFPCETP